MARPPLELAPSMSDPFNDGQQLHSRLPESRRVGAFMSQAERYWLEALNLRIPILAILLASLVIGFIATILETPEFRATARIEISRVDSNVTNVEQLKVDDTSRDQQYYRTQYALLKARSMGERVASALKLSKDPAFTKAFRIAPGKDPRDDKSFAGLLLGRISVVPVTTSNLVDISFESPDPALSARVANSWANEFLETNIERRFGANINARIFLERRLAETRRQLEESERQLIGYATDRQILTITGVSSSNKEGDSGSARSLVATDLEALNTALASAIASRLGAESKLDGRGASAASSQDTGLAALRASRIQLATQYANMTTKFGADYPEVRALAAQLDVLDANLAAEQRRAGRSIDAEYQQARALEEKLRARVEGLKGQYLRQRQEGVRYAILQRDVDTNRQVYDALLQRYKEIGVTGAGTNNMSIVDTALPPGAPFKPSMSRNLLFSLIIGLLISAALAYFRVVIDQSIRDPADVEKLLDLPLLGTIPRVEEGSVMVDLRDKKSELYETYVAARTSLSFLSPEGIPRCLMFTSARPDEGKSVTAVAMAHILSELGRKTVLVDADLRNSGMSDFIELGNGKGVSNFLSGDDFSADLISRVADYQFDVIISGRNPPNPAELLAGDRFAKLMAVLAKHYDQIIIDGPPVLGLADALELSTAVDGVVFVIQSNGTKVRTLQTSLARLESSGARIFGAIVTKLDWRNSAYGYGYGYGYGNKNDGKVAASV